MLVRDPIYTQLNQVLRDMIRSGSFQNGDRFLTERQVSAKFDVSRATANKALSNLVSEGILEFKKGIGTFVRGERLDYDLRMLVSFTEKARSAGKEPSTQVLCLESRNGAQVEAVARLALALEPDETTYYIERLRLADNLPVILERRYLISRHCPALTVELLSGSLYQILTDHYGLDVSGADETIRAVALTGIDATALQVSPGAAGLLVTAIGFQGTDTPLWYEETLYRGDALVSPANSFGDMSGGVDKAIDDFYGGAAQDSVMSTIQQAFLGELPVGMAMVVPLPSGKRFKNLICAPTMRVPGDIQNTINVYLAMRAILVAAHQHNRQHSDSIRQIALSGLGTGVGGMDPGIAAEQMRKAFDNIEGGGWTKIVHPAMAPYAFRQS